MHVDPDCMNLPVATQRSPHAYKAPIAALAAMVLSSYAPFPAACWIANPTVGGERNFMKHIKKIKKNALENEQKKIFEMVQECYNID